MKRRGFLGIVGGALAAAKAGSAAGSPSPAPDLRRDLVSPIPEIERSMRDLHDLRPNQGVSVACWRVDKDVPHLGSFTATAVEPGRGVTFIENGTFHVYSDGAVDLAFGRSAARGSVFVQHSPPEVWHAASHD